MNRKTPILDPRSSVTPDAIDLKFGTRDYHRCHPTCKNLEQSAQQGPAGKGVKYNGQDFIV